MIIGGTEVQVIVDDEDFERLLLFKYRWSGNQRGQGNIQRKINFDSSSKMVSLASDVLNIPGKMVDHINRNIFDNQKLNLRRCNNQQNCCNKNRPKNTSSQYRGVYWCKDRELWRAAIKFNYTTINLGQYKTEKEAAIAYNNAAIIHHKQFASLNII